MPRSSPTGRSPNCRTCSRAATTIRTGRARRGAWSAASRSACSAWCWRRSGRSTTARCIPEESRADLRPRCAGHRRDQHPQRVPRAQPRHAGEGAAKRKPSSAAPAWSSTRNGWRSGTWIACRRTCTTRRRSMRGTRKLPAQQKAALEWSLRRPAGRRRKRGRAVSAVHRAGRRAAGGAAIASSRARSTTA